MPRLSSWHTTTRYVEFGMFTPGACQRANESFVNAFAPRRLAAKEAVRRVPSLADCDQLRLHAAAQFGEFALATLQH